MCVYRKERLQLQETIKTINDLQLIDEERFIEGDVILQGKITLKNSKLIVKGMLWVKDVSYGYAKISMESSTIIADKVLIDPILDKYENSRIIAKEFHSFDY